jgi:hypothetical protein
MKISLLASDIRSGSIATEIGFPWHVRFPPVSDRTADIAGGPFRATTGLMHRSKSSPGSNLPISSATMLAAPGLGVTLGNVILQRAFVGSGHPISCFIRRVVDH